MTYFQQQWDEIKGKESQSLTTLNRTRDSKSLEEKIMISCGLGFLGGMTLMYTHSYNHPLFDVGMALALTCWPIGYFFRVKLYPNEC